MLLQVLRSFKGLAAKVTFVRLEWNMHANVRSDVIALDGGGTAVAPLAGEVQIVGALSPDMALANMVLNCSLEAVLVIMDEKQMTSGVDDCTWWQTLAASQNSKAIPQTCTV